MSHTLVEEQAGFERLFDQLDRADEHLVAIDTEAASFHRYRDRIYLIQLSTQAQTWIIDPLGVDDLARLGRLLADPETETVFHDADYDLRLFNKEYGFAAAALFDTRIAAQLLGLPGIGLAALLESHFAVKADKRFQRADWSRRPLTSEMLDYAAGDTSHLVELSLQLRNELSQKGRLAWAAEEFQILARERSEPVEPDAPRDYLKLKGARKLDRRSLAILRELNDWRESTAAELDRAAFRIMPNEALMALAQHPVDDLAALDRVRGIGKSLVQRHGGEVVAAIARGRAIPDDELPRIERGRRREVDPEVEARLERLKKVRNSQAELLGLQPGVLCPNGTLEAIAREAPDTLAALAAVPGVRNWQCEAIGDALLASVASG